MNPTVRGYYYFFLINYFVQGTIGIVYEPVNYILKDRLHLTPGEASGFIAFMTIPLLLKPFYGYITDFFPIGRHRRKPHLAIASCLAVAAYFGLAFQSRYGYLSVLVPMALSVCAMAFAEAVCGGLLVEDGKEKQQTGRYQALHIGALYLSAVFVGVGGGWMTSHLPYQWIFGIAGLLPLGMILSLQLIHEPDSSQTGRRQTAPIWSFVRTRMFWAMGLTILLWNFYPFLGTVQFYYQSNVLHLSPQWIGSLMTVGSIAGLIGSAVYWKICRKGDITVWIRRAPVLMAGVSLSYLFYRGSVSVAVVETVYGFASVIFRLLLLDLIARICPADAEATTYAMFLALFDVAMYSSNYIGGKLYDVVRPLLAGHGYQEQASVAILILIGSICTLACRWTLPRSTATV